MKIEVIKQTCTACPSQWVGATRNAQSVYIRYRWGYLSVKIDNVEVFGKQLMDDLHGVLTEERLIKILRENNLITQTF